MFKFTVIAALLFITTAVNSLAAVVSWRRVKARFSFYFAVGMTGIAFWTFVSGLDYAAIPISLKIFFAQWEYVFYHLALVFFLLFLLSYAGYDSLAANKFFRTSLVVVAGGNILLAWTNGWHGWLWSGFVPSQFGDNTVIFQHGPAYLWVIGSGYLLLGGIILTAWLISRRNSEYSRRQGRLLFYGSLFPLVGNLVYQFQPPEFDGVDWSSLFLSISSILYLWALYGTRLLNLIPIAREKLMDSLSDGLLVLDLQGRIVDVNQPAVQMLGSLPEKLLGRNLAELPELAQFLSEQSPAEESRTEIEIGTTEKRYFDVLITPLFENRTQLAGRLIIFHDMTSRKENELRLLQLNRAVEQSPTSIVVTDLEGTITYVNPYFSAQSGYTFAEAVGQNPRILKSGYTSPETYRELWETITSGKTWKGELLNKTKNGNLYWEKATISPVFGPDGKIINFLAIKEDITEQKQMAAELKRLATTDPLTGVYNRRQFARLAEIELERGHRYQQPTSLIMMDADYFKNVNDTYGHIAGDKVLVALAQLLTREIRSSDLVARYGGEEFMLLLPETPLEEAKRSAERIRRTVAETPVRVDDQTIRFTISLGVTSSESAGQDFESLLKEADQRLYQAKQSGRNRVFPQTQA